MYNLTFISNVTTEEKAFAQVPEFKDFNCRFFPMDESPERIVAEAGDTDFIFLDAMARLDESVIGSMPNLKLIQSEGVGYQGVDLASARRHNVVVCNNKGINDTAVAECAIFLIMACLKQIITGQRAVYEGRQMEVKMASFGVTREVSECTVGLVGFGDIARATAKYLRAFGARVIYYNRTRYIDLEQEYGVEYASLDELLSMSDFVSLHLAVTDETRNIVNADFLGKMKSDAFLINTARGDLVDNEALLNALLNDDIAGAGLDVIYPEPVMADNILLDSRISDKLVLTPHIAGITSLTVKKLYKNGYDNIMKIINGETPNNIVG